MEDIPPGLVPAVGRRSVDRLVQRDVGGEPLLVRGDEVDPLLEELGVGRRESLVGGVVDENNGPGGGGEEGDGFVGEGEGGGGGGREVVGPGGEVERGVVFGDQGLGGAGDEDGVELDGGVAGGVAGELVDEGLADTTGT